MRRVPRWTPDPTHFPRFELFSGPSPLQRLPRFSAALGHDVDVWIKREDLLPLAFGGNKLRNLEFLIGAALAEGADTLVTSGRRWSNHARLTAAAAAVAGLPVHLVLSGPPTEPPGPGVVLSKLFGATIHQAATSDRGEREALVERVVGELGAEGRRPYVIGVGGGTIAGLVGQVLAAHELIEGARIAGIEFETVVLPSATGGTQAGLLAGLASAGGDARVVGVAVSLPPAELRNRIEGMLGELWRVVRLGPAKPDQIHLIEDQLGPGYGSPTRAAQEAASLLARTEGILVDPIYTAKALAGLIAVVRSGEQDGRIVVFWHSGGGPGILEPLDGLPAG
jgi:1-aminocyclopropane-1-carboxylate deaminase/D-cysteine desulfhydrase-like pyridoxal-dependent ACC family enzyme